VETWRVIAAHWPVSFVLLIAMTGHSKNIVVALFTMLFLPLMLPSMVSARRSPSPLPSLEAFPVLRKVPSGLDPITSDPPPPPATNVRTFDLAVVREVLPVNQAHN
jgi:hypothetical protein